MKDALYNLPKTIAKNPSPPLPAIDVIEDSYDEKSDNGVEGQRIEKIVIPSTIIDIYTKLEVLLSL